MLKDLVVAMLVVHVDDIKIAALHTQFIRNAVERFGVTKTSPIPASRWTSGTLSLIHI